MECGLVFCTDNYQVMFICRDVLWVKEGKCYSPPEKVRRQHLLLCLLSTTSLNKQYVHKLQLCIYQQKAHWLTKTFHIDSFIWSRISFFSYCAVKNTRPYSTFTLPSFLVPLEAWFALAQCACVCLIANCILPTWICFLSTYISIRNYWAIGDNI